MQSTKRRQWDIYTWPEWVPGNVRKDIMEFWSPKQGRGPDEWLEDTKRQTPQPAMGELVVMQRDERETLVSGLWIHCWNNMGRVITDEGKSISMSTCWWPLKVRALKSGDVLTTLEWRYLILHAHVDAKAAMEDSLGLMERGLVEMSIDGGGLNRARLTAEGQRIAEQLVGLLRT